jgi:hypothetical protein
LRKVAAASVPTFTKNIPKSVQASFDYDHPSELDFMKESLTDGLAIFERLFGYQSKSFIPNNYTWPRSSMPPNGQRRNGYARHEIPIAAQAGRRDHPTHDTPPEWSNHNGYCKPCNVQFEPSLLPEAQSLKW